MRTYTDTEREQRTVDRMKAQADLTALCEYSLEDDAQQEATHRFATAEVADDYHHLLSEGVVVDAYSKPFAIIAKGSIMNWYNALDPSVTFDIDLGHDTLSPIFRQIGTWSKSDLKLVEQSDGRLSMYVQLNLDEESIAVQEIRRKSTLLGLSVEFYSDSELVTFQDSIVPVHSNLDIIGFAVVGEPQDAKSGNIDLSKKVDTNVKEDYSVDKGSFLNAIKHIFSVDETVEDASSEEQAVPETVEDAIVEDEQVEDEKVEEVEEVEEDIVEEVSVNESFTLDDVSEVVLAGFEAQNKLLEEKFTAQRKRIEELESKLATVGKFSLGAPTTTNKNKNKKVGF